MFKIAKGGRGGLGNNRELNQNISSPNRFITKYASNMLFMAVQLKPHPSTFELLEKKCN
jgi:GTPase involved in cell partitioning and DNA repair